MSASVGLLSASVGLLSRPYLKIKHLTSGNRRPNFIYVLYDLYTFTPPLYSGARLINNYSRKSFYLKAKMGIENMSDNDAAIDALKDKLEDELISRGINPRRNFKCLNPAHEDNEPSMSYHREGRRVNCFSSSCNASYDLIDLIREEHGFSFIEALEYGCNKYGIPFTPKGNKDYKPQQKTAAPSTQKAEARKEEAAARQKAEAERKAKEAREVLEQKKPLGAEVKAYLESRGISKATAEAHGVGQIQTKYGVKLLIPNGETSCTERSIDPAAKVRYKNTGSAALFNAEALYSARAVHVTEGAIDALSIIEAGGQAIALNSTSNASLLISELEKATRDASKPLKCKELIITLDNDQSGLETGVKLKQDTEALIRNTPALDIEVFRLNVSGDHNDPNEALVNDPEGLKRALSLRVDPAVTKAYENTSAANRLIDFFNGIRESVNTPAIPTGFRKLDKALDDTEGGLYEGLYIIAAITSLGKTAFILQMADQIAQQGKDVLYISLEMAESELIARSISRITRLKALEETGNMRAAKTVRGITNGKLQENYTQQEKDIILKAYNDYYRYAGNLYFYEGLGNIGIREVRNRAEQHKRITGNTPVIFVDYVQILAPYNERGTDKQNIDKAALELKRLSRDLKTPVIVVSSLNRQSYKDAIQLEALKESGALEYSSDAVIGLQLKGAGTNESKSAEWLNEQKAKTPREIEAVILKNRNGKSGDKIRFNYYPLFNYYEEQTENRSSEWGNATRL